MVSQSLMLIFVQDASVSGLEGPYVISSRETELESSASLRLAELERGSMVSLVTRDDIMTDNHYQVRSVESVPRDRDRIFKVIDVSQVLCIVSHPHSEAEQRHYFKLKL